MLSTYPRAFWVMCASNLLFFSSFNLIIPELPDYLTSLGGAEYKGFIISIFTFTALISRPFSGRLTDKVGRVPVMIFGILVCVVIGFFYPILDFVMGFFFLRLLHGFSTGFTPTGNAAYVADIVPFNKRGEAMGYLGFSNSLGIALGPALGSQLMIWLHHDYQVLFWASSGLALLSLIIILRVPETLQEKEKLKLQHFKVNWQDVYEPKVLAPAVVMSLTTVSFGVVLTLIPDLCTQIGMENKGTFFTVFTLSSLLSRIFSGRASDKWGRSVVLLFSTSSLAIAMCAIGLAQSTAALLIAAAIFGVAIGINSPSIFAWAIDRSDQKQRGRGMATVYIALELGIGCGAIAAGFMYGNVPEHMPRPFFMGAILALLAFAYVAWWRKYRRGSTPA